MRIVRDGASAEFQLVSLGAGPPAEPAANTAGVLSANQAGFPNTFSNVDVQYVYLPRLFKELIILNSNTIPTPTNLNPQTDDLKITFKITPNNLALVTTQGIWNQLDTITTTEGITFQQNNNSVFHLVKPFVYDSAYTTTDASYELKNVNNELFLTIIVPYAFLTNPTTLYPVFIDPTISLDDKSIIFNGYLERVVSASESYMRVSNPSQFLRVGFMNVTRPTYDRSVIEWNISSVPKDVDVLALNVTVDITKVGDGDNNNLTFRAMVGNSTSYPNTAQGNANFYNDTGNGTTLAATLLGVAGTYFFNLASLDGGQDFEARLNSGAGWWSFGIHTPELVPGTQNFTLISSKNNPNAGAKPLLRITYEFFANETAAETAIQQGILNSLPTATIYNEQQIITRNVSNYQQLGRFDKFATSGNKRWAFNYITDGETFTNMLNLSKTVFIFEFANLTASQITAQVSAYINATKNL